MADHNQYRVQVAEAAYEAVRLTEVVADIFRAFPGHWENKRVLVKPNILAGHPPEAGVTTHPALVKAVVAQLRRENAAEVLVGDNPGLFGYGKSLQAAEKAGIKEAAGEAYVHLGRRPVKVSVPSDYIKEVMLAGDVLAVDRIINLPKLKTHGLTYFTGAVKNTFGYVVGGDKMRIHADAGTPKRFNRALVDIFALRPPDLNIMDAVEAMEGNGPSNGRVRRVGKILASDNAVSLDAVALRLVGKNPRSVPHLVMAAARGLGAIDPDAIHLDGSFEPLTEFKMPATFVPGVMGLVLNRVLSRWINCTPVVVTENCRQCGLCVEHCPVGAMEMGEDGYPVASKKLCISCYCCQEMCPADAIVLQGRVMSFLRR